MQLKKQLSRIIPLFAFVFSGYNAYSQFEIANTEYLPKLKDGITYVAMHDTASVKSREYKEIIRKYWDFSKIKFINNSQISAKIEQGVSFLTIGGYETTTQFTTLYSDGSSKEGINYSTTHIYLEFWTINDKYYQKKKAKPVSNDDRLRIGRVELFTDFPTLNMPGNIYKEEYDMGGHVRNWGPGFVKNYIQALNALLKKGEERKLYDKYTDPQKLKSLKTQTLYVPDYILIKFNKFTGDETEKHDEKDVFEDYEFKYKLVSNTEINQMIMTSDDKPFYYLIYIKSCTDKFLTVMDSKTGEFIYTVYVPVSYNISSKDLKSLSSAIKG